MINWSFHLGSLRGSDEGIAAVVAAVYDRRCFQGGGRATVIDRRYNCTRARSARATLFITYIFSVRACPRLPTLQFDELLPHAAGTLRILSRRFNSRADAAFLGLTVAQALQLLGQ